MKLLVALLVALVPGAVAWWLGRRLLRSQDSPALAELWWRVRRRQVQVAAVCMVAVAMLSAVHAVWIVPLLVVVALAGAFPARRALLEEQWRLGGYLGWLARLVTVFAGFWILVMLGPSLVAWAGPDRMWVPVAVASAMAIRLLLPQRRVLALLGATPMDAAEVHGLPEFMDQLGECSTAPAPHLHRLDLRGGRWVNAIAMPHATLPAAVFSQPLLDFLAPAEVRAVLAHEVAHLEHYNPRRLRWRTAGAFAMATLSVLLIPMSRPLVTDSSWVSLGWLVLLLVLFAHRLTRHREHEAASDLRALELCQDAEALISALRTLHEANQVPRRLSRKDEDRSTHPSLARRIQAIRSAAATTSDAQGYPAADVSSPSPSAVVAGARDGEWVVFDGDRVTWLEGVPAAAGTDPDSMQTAAAVTRSIAYQGLAELRVRVRTRGRAALVAVATTGERSSTALAPDAVGVAQKALDAIDARLAPPPRHTFLTRTAGATRSVRPVAALVALMALPLPAAGAIATSTLLALIRPRTTWLLAAGAGCLTGAALSLVRLTGAHELLQVQRAGIAVAALAALYFLAVGSARAAHRRDVHDRTSWVPALALGVTLLLVWTGVLAFSWLAGGGTLDPYWLYRGVRWSPSLVAFPLALATTLAVGRRWQLRCAAGGAVVLAAIALWLGSGVFRDAFVEDPLLPSTMPPEVVAVVAEKVVERDLEAGGFRLRLSPDGSLAAVGRQATRDSDEAFTPPAVEWAVLRLDDPDAPELTTIEASEIAILDGEQALLLKADTEHQSASGHATANPLTLTLVSLAEGADSIWSTPVAGVFQPQLAVDAETRRWQVTGRENRPDGVWGWLVVEGHLGSDGAEESRWAVDTGFAQGWTALGGGTALAVATGFDDRPADIPLAWLGAWARHDLLLVNDQATTSLARTRLQVSCVEYGPGVASCAASDGDASYLWQVRAGEERDPRLEPIARVRGAGLFMSEEFDGGALLWSPQRDDVVVLGRDSASPYRVQLTGAGWQAAVAASRSGTLAEIRHDEDGGRLVVYRLP